MAISLKNSLSLLPYQPIPESSEEGPPVTFQSTGVVRVVVQSAEIYKKYSSFCTPNPFVRIRVSGHEEIGCTNWRPKTFSPNWRFQSHYALVKPSDEQLELDVMNYHTFRRPTLIGSAVFLLTPDEELREWNVEATLLKGRRLGARGCLLFNVFYYPEIQTEATDSLQTGPGIVRVTLHEVRGLQCNYPIVATLSLGWNEFPLHTTTPATCGDGPLVWNSAFEFLSPDKQATFIVVKLTKVRWKRSLLAHVSIPLRDLLQDPQDGKWLPLSGQTTGQLKVSAEWKSVRTLKLG